MAIGPNITLKEGAKAPAFTAKTSGGGKVSLKDLFYTIIANNHSLDRL